MTDASIIAIAMGAPLTIAVSALIVAGYKLLGYHKTLQAMDDERDAAVQESDRLKFELASAEAARDAERKRAIAFEEALADVEANPNSDLDPLDVARRVRRAAEAAARRADGVPDGTDGAVHSASTSSDTGAAEVPAGELRSDGLMQP